MQPQKVDILPLFPTAPAGVARKEHLPTVEESIRYWEAIRVLATQANDAALEQTATGLKLSYEEARLDLTGTKPEAKAERPKPVRQRSRLRLG
jgi:hypothetical protein